MNKILLTVIVAAIGALATGVQAAEADGSEWLNVAAATKTRAQVGAELQQARRDGTVGASGSTYKWLARSQSVAPRDDVKAEFRQARANGMLPVAGEAYDGRSAPAQRPASLRQTLAALAR